MFREIPVSSRICFDKILKRDYKLHEQRLNSLRSSIPSCSYQVPKFLKLKLKQKVIKKLQEKKIAQQNRNLEKRMLEQRRLKVENNQEPFLKQRESNREAVKKLLSQDLAYQNRLHKQRLERQKTQYPVAFYDRHYQTNEKYASNISRFKYHSLKPNKSFTNFWCSAIKPLSSLKPHQTLQEAQFPSITLARLVRNSQDRTVEVLLNKQGCQLSLVVLKNGLKFVKQIEEKDLQGHESKSLEEWLMSLQIKDGK